MNMPPPQIIDLATPLMQSAVELHLRGGGGGGGIGVIKSANPVQFVKKSADPTLFLQKSESDPKIFVTNSMFIFHVRHAC